LFYSRSSLPSSVETLHWTRKQQYGDLPLPRSRYGITRVGKKLVMVGGLHCAEIVFLRAKMADLHVLDTGMQQATAATDLVVVH